MNLIIIAIAAIILYLTATAWLGYRFVTSVNTSPDHDPKLLLLCLPALLLHAVVLYQLIFTEMGLNMGFYNALSLVSWVVTLMVVLTTIIKPTINLAMIILPATALALFLEFIIPSRRIVPETSNLGIDIHIILSIAAYSLLTIAALQAVILAIQEHQLRTKHPVKMMRLLPPMQIMEDLLVQLLWVGFFFLSLGLATGLMFVHDIFTQHLVHKTVLTILAWIFFGLVLFGRWAWGWRGKSLVRWTLGGFVLLMLGYFGSKFVLELVLDRV
jgi:ABC-type uncharacterized transport system permease subunit